jgi:hypothetical protein
MVLSSRAASTSSLAAMAFSKSTIGALMAYT